MSEVYEQSFAAKVINGHLELPEEAKQMLNWPGIQVTVMFSQPPEQHRSQEVPQTAGAKLLAKLRAKGLIGFAKPRPENFAEALRDVTSRRDREGLNRLLDEQE
jgi:hypothetical protein